MTLQIQVVGPAPSVCLSESENVDFLVKKVLLIIINTERKEHTMI